MTTKKAGRWALPAGHRWVECSADGAEGLNYLWQCEKCEATFHVHVDQDDAVTTHFEPGDDSCEEGA